MKIFTVIVTLLPIYPENSFDNHESWEVNMFSTIEAAEKFAKRHSGSCSEARIEEIIVDDYNSSFSLPY